MSTLPSIHHHERVVAKWFPLLNTVEVDVIWNATLADDLSFIVSRRASSIDITLGQGDKRHTISMTPEEAEWIGNALLSAVDTAKDDAILTTRDADRDAQTEEASA